MSIAMAMRQGVRQLEKSIFRSNSRSFYTAQTKPSTRPIPHLYPASAWNREREIPCNFIRPFAAAAASSESDDSEFKKYVGYAILLIGCGIATYYSFPLPKKKSPQQGASPSSSEESEVHTVSNWSGTYEVQTRVYGQPETLKELEAMVNEANKRNIRIRPVGSGLSPNGIGLSSEGMISLALLDKVLHVDQDKKTVTVQAGIRVSQLVEELKRYDLTLQNFASIREQQLGGITQVGAHGTGARIPPIDEQVIAMKLVTPAQGTIEISAEKDPELFYLARCGLGGLGVVAEMTIQCVPRHQLVEYTFISNIKEIRKKHKKWLAENQHLRYMWIPYTDVVVVVQCNPLAEGKEPPKFTPKYGRDEALQPARNLYKDLLKKSSAQADDKPSTEQASTEEDINELSFMELRDKLIALDPLNKEHIAKVNLVEAEYWKRSEGYRVGWSDEILGFDCGGQQWVSEICFPAGTLAKPTMKDIEYLQQILQMIKKEKLPAPAPIEQRWTARSRSLMSPASSINPDDLFSWVGIIMYLPTADTNQRKEITSEFFKYRRASQKQFWDSYSAYEHWAKIEVPDNDEELAWVQERLRRRFPVDAYNTVRQLLDPKQILTNHVMEKLFPIPENPGEGGSADEQATHRAADEAQEVERREWEAKWHEALAQARANLEAQFSEREHERVRQQDLMTEAARARLIDEIRAQVREELIQEDMAQRQREQAERAEQERLREEEDQRQRQLDQAHEHNTRQWLREGRCPYFILGINCESSWVELRRHIRRISARFHPDVGASQADRSWRESSMQGIQQAANFMDTKDHRNTLDVLHELERPNCACRRLSTNP